MNLIQDSLKNIRASKELKQNTLQYLQERQNKTRRFRTRVIYRYAFAIATLLLLIGASGYSVYRRPVSYISIDVNPSIELGINRFEKVVSTKSYNEEGQTVTEQVSLKNVSYMQAIDRLLKDDAYSPYLTKNSLLVFTVISDHAEAIVEELNASEVFQNYDALTYTSDSSCMEEAHQHHMSFGKYRTYLELLQYDDGVTIDDCHSMSMAEMHNKIASCKHEENAEENTEEHSSHHESHHQSGNSQTE